MFDHVRRMSRARFALSIAKVWLMGKSESPVHFSLYNNRGQLAREWPLLQLPGEVPLTGLPAGIYFLHGTTGNRTFAHKIIRH